MYLIKLLHIQFKMKQETKDDLKTTWKIFVEIIVINMCIVTFLGIIVLFSLVHWVFIFLFIPWIFIIVYLFVKYVKEGEV